MGEINTGGLNHLNNVSRTTQGGSKHKEIANTLHQGASLYRNKKLPKIEGWFNAHRFLDQGNVKYKGEIYSLFSARKLYDIYKNLGVEVKTCKSIEEVTVALKDIFAPYLSQFPKLAASTNRAERNSIDLKEELKLLMQKRAEDNHVPYVGVGDHDNDNSYVKGKGRDLGIWLPIILLDLDDYEKDTIRARVCININGLTNDAYVAAASEISEITSKPISYEGRIGSLFLLPTFS